ncbi:hypothetical protein C5B42_05535 [Candidatus Cerribacteria bacterium 'Amazon FNV 2010 28 9']|uniref:UPF0102 protein C5B42_05535 n=1 Tax=Candidatus Cerribacteria bacterium 'Amazon FNV 2010 28 9' TaxID=2081795 RepID=A0A317JMT5_9BACT|nr:MAG: hypothetical protein C5B42_05535 [Candidatus Cerribacteria bacterium 'Amazon FNV 2010 28 9']
MKRNQEVGHSGEEKATLWLEAHDFMIHGRNVRTRFGEHDIVAQKNGTLHFVEVKTRTSNAFGEGIHAITRPKLQRMIAAAESTIHQLRWQGPFQLDCISINKDGNITFFENITMDM